MSKCLSNAHGTQTDQKIILLNNSFAFNTFYTRSSIIIFLANILFFDPLYAVRPPKDLDTHSRKKHCSDHSEYEQEKTFTSSDDLKNSTQQILINLLETAPENFQHNNTAKLLHAIDLFYDVPGFFSTLKKVVNQARQDAFNHGYLYEIETALAQEAHGEKVCSFDREHLAEKPFHNHEIDVETLHYHIECKDIFWKNHHLLSNPGKLKRQLSEQRALIEEENRWTNRPKKFILFSKQSIPPDWQQWLTKQRIAYQCTSKVDSISEELSPSSSLDENMLYSLSSSSSLSDESAPYLLSASSSLSDDSSQG